jgi:hypothetical protein
LVGVLLDPSQWWDYRSEKATEHQSCQNSRVDGAITAFVGVNLVALSKQMQYAGGKGQHSFLCSNDNIYAWNVENAWLISLIWIIFVDN